MAKDQAMTPLERIEHHLKELEVASLFALTVRFASQRLLKRATGTKLCGCVQMNDCHVEKYPDFREAIKETFRKP